MIFNLLETLCHASSSNCNKPNRKHITDYRFSCHFRNPAPTLLASGTRRTHATETERLKYHFPQNPADDQIFDIFDFL